jgi:hypothetical protein
MEEPTELLEHDALAVVSVLEDLGCAATVAEDMRRALRSRLPLHMHDTMRPSSTMQR